MGSRQYQAPLSRSDITWKVSAAARDDLTVVKDQLGAAGYEENKVALQDFLCQYFNSEAQCIRKGCNVSPMGMTTKLRGKRLKVRWALPGGGKSGGLRLAVVAYCERREVVIVAAWARKDDPDDADFERAFRNA